MSASNLHHIEVDKILKETENAFLLQLVDSDDQIWIPKSQISDASDYAEGDEDITMSISEWIAKEKGLI